MKKAGAFVGAILIFGLTLASCDNPVGYDSPLPILTGTISITGDAQVGLILTADTTHLDGEGDVSFQWRRVTQDSGVNIGTGYSYVVQSGDVGSYIIVAVTRLGFSNARRSDPVLIVADDNGNGNGDDNDREDFIIRHEDFLSGTNDYVTIFIMDGSPQERKITLLDPQRYDRYSIRWYLGTTQLTGESVVSGYHGETLTVNARTFDYGLGVHIITLRVRMGDVPYSVLISIDVRG